VERYFFFSFSPFWFFFRQFFSWAIFVALSWVSFLRSHLAFLLVFERCSRFLEYYFLTPPIAILHPSLTGTL